MPASVSSPVKSDLFFRGSLMTFLFSLLQTWGFIFIFLVRWGRWEDKCICSLLLSKVYLYLRMHLKAQAAVTRRWHCSLWIVRCKCMKKKARAGDSAQSSRECCGSRNIWSLKCFLKHFWKRHRDRLSNYFSLSPSFFHPSASFFLAFSPPLQNTTALHLQCIKMMPFLLCAKMYNTIQHNR